MIAPMREALGVITINVDPVAVHIGSIGVHWYGVMYALAFVAGYKFGVLPHLLPRGVTRPEAERLLTATIVTGLIGARLYFVLQQPDLGVYLRNPIRILAVWEGGMAFFGAIIAGAMTVGYFAWRERRYSFWLLWDAAVFFAVVGQPIGRIGNVINGDILGTASNAWFATAYTYPTSTDHCAVLQSHFQCGLGYQPAAIYEALGTIAIGLILVGLRRRRVGDGVVGICYLGLYALSQFLIFFLRDSEPVIGLGLKQAQWTALFMMLLVVPVAMAIRRRWPPHRDQVGSEIDAIPPQASLGLPD